MLLSMPVHDLVSIVLFSVVDSFAILSNALLLAAIVFRSPPSLRGFRSYSVLLFNATLIDLVAAISSLLLMVRLVPGGGALAYVYLGPCRLVSGYFCHIAYSTLLHTTAQSLVLIALSFAFRLYILQRSDRPCPTPRIVILICFIAYLPSLFMLISFLFTLDPPDEVRAMIRKFRPEYNLDSYLIEGHTSVLKFLTCFTMLFMTLPITPMLIGIVFLRKKVIGTLLRKLSKMSKRTLEMHQTLIKVLTLQTCLPALFSVAVVSYVLCQIDLYWNPILEHLVMEVFSFIPAMAPCITLYFVLPYRLFVLELIGRAPAPKKTSAISPVTTSTSIYITGPDERPGSEPAYVTMA